MDQTFLLDREARDTLALLLLDRLTIRPPTISQELWRQFLHAEQAALEGETLRAIMDCISVADGAFLMDGLTGFRDERMTLARIDLIPPARVSIR